MGALFPDSPPMRDDGAAFLAGVRANPGEDLPRLIYADWLQEQGQDERAELIRVQCEIFRLRLQGTPAIYHPHEPDAAEKFHQLKNREVELLTQLPWQRGDGFILRRGFVEEWVGLWKDFKKNYPAFMRHDDWVLRRIHLRSFPVIFSEWTGSRDHLKAHWAVNRSPVWVPNDDESSLMRMVGKATLKLFARDFPGHCYDYIGPGELRYHPIDMRHVHDQDWLARCILRAKDEVTDVRKRGRVDSAPQPPLGLFVGAQEGDEPADGFAPDEGDQ